MIKSALSCLLVLIALTGAPLAAQEIAAMDGERLEAAAGAQAAGDYDLAREILQALLATSPDNPDLLRRLAMVEAGDENLALAMDLIDRAARLAPRDLDIALARGYILYWRGNLADAQKVVAAISAQSPDYPELAELTAALDRTDDASGLRLRALSISAGLSEIMLENGGSSTWNVQSGTAAIDLSREDTVTFGIMREERSVIDTRLSMRVDHRLADGFVYVAATAVPHSDFQERWSVTGGGEFAAAKGLSALVDLRIADYDTGAIVVVRPGLRIALAGDFVLTGRAINIFDDAEGHRLGGALRLDYQPEDKASLFAIAASYPDAEADGVRQLRSAAAGFAVPVSETLTLSAAGSYEDRKSSYRRWTGTLALILRFGPR